MLLVGTCAHAAHRDGKPLAGGHCLNAASYFLATDGFSFPVTRSSTGPFWVWYSSPKAPLALFRIARMYWERCVADAASGQTSTLAPHSAPSWEQETPLSYKVAADTYPPGRPILLFGSLSSVMVTTLVTDGTAAFTCAATEDASRAAAVAVVVVDGAGLAVADVDIEDVDIDGATGEGAAV